MRYDVLSSRKDKNGTWRNIKIGAAFPKDGGKIDIVLDALPISIWEGQIRMTLFEAKPKEEKQQAPDQPAGSDMNDDIPF